MALVVYREFKDGECEMGVLTLEHGFWWVNVGNFDYCLSLNNFENIFTIIGVL